MVVGVGGWSDDGASLVVTVEVEVEVEEDDAETDAGGKAEREEELLLQIAVDAWLWAPRDLGSIIIAPLLLLNFRYTSFCCRIFSSRS